MMMGPGGGPSSSNGGHNQFARVGSANVTKNEHDVNATVNVNASSACGPQGKSKSPVGVIGSKGIDVKND